MSALKSGSGVFIYPNLKKNNALKTATEVCGVLLECGYKILMDESFKPHISVAGITFAPENELISKSDIAVAIGGDGTILECAKKVIPREIPILGINSGRLGFMASVESTELHLLKELLCDYHTEKRMLLNILHRHSDGEESYIAMNDLVVASAYSKLCDLELYGEGRLITAVRADGVVFSTPTGSTAYSLSAGGPIIEPQMECVEFVPICPHSLFARPMVFAADKELTLKRASGGAKMYFCADGTKNIPFSSEDELIVSKSEHFVRLINLKEGGFYSAVNEKLMRSIKG